MNTTVLSRRTIVAALAGLLAVASLPGFVAVRASAQGGVPAQAFQYAAKFVCVTEVGPRSSAFVLGDYRTAVNVHNPNTTTVVFIKKAVIADSEDRPRGVIGPFVEVPLKPDEAVEIDCKDIKTVLLGGVAQPIGDGFVVIASDLPLDVVAVYTMRFETPGTGLGESIDVERIEPSAHQ
jgi:hypothetical protein